MFQIGASLAAARGAQGLGLGDAERLTCLRQKYLAALENDDFDVLPGRTYARAFLRTYADALGLDANRFVTEFDLRVPAPTEEDLVIVLPGVGRAFPVRLLAVGVVAAGLFGAVAWAAFTPNEPHLQATPAAKAAQPPKHRVLATHQTAPALPVRPQPLLIRAVGGSCWVLVRKGGATGPVLYEGTIGPGHTLRFAPRVWVRLGAPWNVTVRRGSHTFPAASRTEPQNLVA